MSLLALSSLADLRGVVVFLGLATLLITTIGVSGGPTNLRGTGQLEQVLVFDAGSSGTRIHVFNLLPADDPTRAHVPVVDLSVRAKQTLKVKPGLSSFAERDDLEGTQKNIEQLLEFANQFVLDSRRSSTPALLKATAGLRAVSAEKAEAVLGRVRETLAASGYRFQPEWADIIKGKEEGGLAWVAANYLEGTFQREEAWIEHGEEIKEDDTARGGSVGVIEMGGGSTQVSFQVRAADILGFDDTFVFDTGLGRRYWVYAHSYLGYGQDHAQKHVRESLLASEAEDPCYPRGYARPGAAGAAEEGAAAVVRGSGDRHSCTAKIEAALLAASSAEAPGRYAKELPLHGKVVATENFFYVQGDASLDLEGKVVGPADFEAGADKVCAAALYPSAEDAAKMEAGTADISSPKTCFGLAYQAALLKALKVTESGIEVKVAHKIGGGDVDWALGAALAHHLTEHESRTKEGIHHLPMWALVLVLLGGVPLIARIMMGYTCARQAVQQVTGIKPSKIGASNSRAE